MTVSTRNPALQPLARELMTEAEHRLWYLLRGKRLQGIQFRRQQSIGSYIVDFVSRAHGACLVIANDCRTCWGGALCGLCHSHAAQCYAVDSMGTQFITRSKPHGMSPALGYHRWPGGGHPPIHTPTEGRPTTALKITNQKIILKMFF